MKLIKLLVIATLLTCATANASDYKQAEVYSGLRAQILSLSADELGMHSPVLAVLMEIGYPEAVATLVSVADGAASLYYSDGGGIIGAGGYQQVRDSALALVKVAEQNRDKFSRTESYPLPQNGFTRFYIVTTDGVITDEVHNNDLGNDKHVLSPIFFHGHELISHIRAAHEHRSNEQGVQVNR